jgi:hypothetical protein
MFPPTGLGTHHGSGVASRTVQSLLDSMSSPLDRDWACVGTAHGASDCYRANLTKLDLGG